MEEQPSVQLLRILRKTAKARGLNTASLANTAGIPRGEMKRVLGGLSPLSVDVFARLAQALNIGEAELTNTAFSTNQTESPKLTPIAHQEAQELPPIDPLGNHADQIIRLGFALGCDLTLVLITNGLADAGFPESVIEKHPQQLPIRLDAAFHQHNDPSFLPEKLRLTLSFDALYTVHIPWQSIAHVVIQPLDTGPAPIKPEPPIGKATHLRLVD